MQNKFNVTKPFNIDRTLYKLGDIVELTNGEASHQLSLGRIKPVKPKGNAPKNKQAAPSNDGD